MLNIQLLSDKILVEVEETETKNPSGLIVSKVSDPGDVKTGKVVAMGRGKWGEKVERLLPMEVMLGDTVWYQYGTKVIIEGKSYILLTESGDVVGIHMAPERN